MFPAASSFNMLFNLTTCIRMSDDYGVTDSSTSARNNFFALTRAQENRDSMGLLEAIFTGRWMILF